MELVSVPPSPTMDTPAPAQSLVNDGATTFINAHTVVDYDVPLLDECPICLDNFSSEPCLRVIGIEGCSHHVGMKCLEEMLRSQPNQEKKCPLCRTVWIAAPAAPIRQAARRTPTSHRMAGMFEPFDSIGGNVAAGVGVALLSQNANSDTIGDESVAGNPQGTVPVPRNPRNTTIQSPILLDSDSDSEDYNTQLEKFEQLTRDIESVRSRARNTQLSRRRRQEPRSRQRGASMTASQGTNTSTGGSNAAAGNNSAGGDGTFNFFQRSLNPFRPTANDTMPTYTAARDRDGRRPSIRRAPSSAQNHTQTFFRAAGVVNPPNSHTPSLASPTAMDANENIALSKQLEAQVREAEHLYLLDQRKCEMDTREHHLQRRDLELTTREVRLTKRETELLGRERALMDKEHRTRQLMATMTAQREAMEKLLRRQREEIDRAMR